MPRVDPVAIFAVPKPPHGETNDESVRNPAPTTSTEAPAAIGSETAEGITAASATGGAATTSAATSPPDAFPSGSPRKKSRRLNETPTTCERPGVSDGDAHVISPEDATVAATGATAPKAHAASPVSLNPTPEMRTGAPPAEPDENVNDGSAPATAARVRYAAATADSGTATPAAEGVSDAAPDGIAGDSNAAIAEETTCAVTAEETESDDDDATTTTSSDSPPWTARRLDPTIQSTPPPSLGCSDGFADPSSGAGTTRTWPNGFETSPAPLAASDRAKKPPRFVKGGIFTVATPNGSRGDFSIASGPATPSRDTPPS